MSCRRPPNGAGVNPAECHTPEPTPLALRPLQLTPNSHPTPMKMTYFCLLSNVHSLHKESRELPSVCTGASSFRCQGLYTAGPSYVFAFLADFILVLKVEPVTSHTLWTRVLSLSYITAPSRLITGYGARRQGLTTNCVIVYPSETKWSPFVS